MSALYLWFCIYRFNQPWMVDCVVLWYIFSERNSGINGLGQFKFKDQLYIYLSLFLWRTLTNTGTYCASYLVLSSGDSALNKMGNNSWSLHSTGENKQTKNFTTRQMYGKMLEKSSGKQQKQGKGEADILDNEVQIGLIARVTFEKTFGYLWLLRELTYVPWNMRCSWT